MALFFSMNSQQIHTMGHAGDPEPDVEDNEDAITATIELQADIETTPLSQDETETTPQGTFTHYHPLPSTVEPA